MAELTLQNIAKLYKKMGKLEGRFKEVVNEQIKRGVLKIHGDAVSSIQAHKSSGNSYGNHTASKPGFPPNTDTGRLVSSVKFDIQNTENGIIGLVGTNLPYGPMLEFGTSQMEARPWLGPAFKKNVKPIMKAINAEADKLIKKAKDLK